MAAPPRPRRPAPSRGRGGGWHWTPAVRPPPAPVARNLTWRPPAARPPPPPPPHWPRPPSKNLAWRPPPPNAAAAPAEPASSAAPDPASPTKPASAAAAEYVASPRRHALFRVDPKAAGTAGARPVPKAAPRTPANARKAPLMAWRPGQHLSLVRASPSLLAAYVRYPRPRPPPPPPPPPQRRAQPPWRNPRQCLYMPWWTRPLPLAPRQDARAPVPRWSPSKAGKPFVRHRQLVLRPMTYVDWPKRTARNRCCSSCLGSVAWPASQVAPGP